MPQEMPLDIQWLVYALVSNNALTIEDAQAIMASLPEPKLTAFAEAVIDRITVGMQDADVNNVAEQMQEIVNYASEQAETGDQPPWNESVSPSEKPRRKRLHRPRKQQKNESVFSVSPDCDNEKKGEQEIVENESAGTKKGIIGRLLFIVIGCLVLLIPLVINVPNFVHGIWLVAFLIYVPVASVFFMHIIKRLDHGIKILLLLVLGGFIAWAVFSSCQREKEREAATRSASATSPRSPMPPAPAPVAEKKPEVKKSETTVTVKLNLYDKGNNRINPMFSVWVYRDERFIYEAERMLEKIDKAYGRVSKNSSSADAAFDDFSSRNFGVSTTDTGKALSDIHASMDLTTAIYSLTKHCTRNYEKCVVFKDKVRSGSDTFRLGNGGRCFIHLQISYYNDEFYVFKLINLDGVDKTLEITNEDLHSFGN